jgi:hypothetical protein
MEKVDKPVFKRSGSDYLPDFNFGLIMPLDDLFRSVSEYRSILSTIALLTCDEKFCNVRAAVNVDLTAVKYDRNEFDYQST